MVETYEEDSKGFLKTQQLNTLQAILYRYIKDAYKQFGWKPPVVFYEKLDKFSVLTTECELLRDSHIQLILRGLGENKLKCNFIVMQPNKYGRMINNIDEEVFYQINSNMTPKELGKLALNIFKWFKQQMRKVDI